jgi:hypothetical protein
MVTKNLRYCSSFSKIAVGPPESTAKKRVIIGFRQFLAVMDQRWINELASHADLIDLRPFGGCTWI